MDWTTRRRLLALGGTALATGMAGCTGDGGGGDGGDASPSPTPTDGGSGPDQEIVVGADGLNYAPAEVAVPVGSTVQWVWEGDFHTVTPDSIPGDSDWEGTGTTTHDTGYTHSHTFEVAGTYDYYCDPHRSQGMVGTLTVGSDGGGSDDATPTDGGGDGGAY
jgi:plastocyanin